MRIQLYLSNYDTSYVSGTRILNAVKPLYKVPSKPMGIVIRPVAIPTVTIAIAAIAINSVTAIGSTLNTYFGK